MQLIKGFNGLQASVTDSLRGTFDHWFSFGIKDR